MNRVELPWRPTCVRSPAPTPRRSSPTRFASFSAPAPRAQFASPPRLVDAAQPAYLDGFQTEPAMPQLITEPTFISAAGNKPKRIEEFIGRVNSGHEGI